MENLEQNQPQPILEWESYSRQNIKRSDDWFWGLGLITGVAALISLIMGNILLTMIIGLAGFLVYKQEREPTDTKLMVKITKKGVQLNNELYTYEKIRSFWVEEAQPEENKPPMLILHYRRIFVPNIHIPITNLDPEEVRLRLLRYGEEEKHIETFSEQVFDLLGF